VLPWCVGFFLLFFPLFFLCFFFFFSSSPFTFVLYLHSPHAHPFLRCVPLLTGAMSSVEVQEGKPAVAKSWDSLPPELHLAIFREFLALGEHVDHHYPDSCREILETPSDWDLSTRRSWHMYRRRNVIAPLDTPIDQNTSKCDVCVDINSALTVCSK
jgi:hypothetical protein